MLLHWTTEKTYSLLTATSVITVRRLFCMVEKIPLYELLPEFSFSDRARGLSEKTIKKHFTSLSIFFEFISSEFNIKTLDRVYC